MVCSEYHCFDNRCIPSRPFPFLSVSYSICSLTCALTYLPLLLLYRVLTALEDASLSNSPYNDIRQILAKKYPNFPAWTEIFPASVRSVRDRLSSVRYSHPQLLGINPSSVKVEDLDDGMDQHSADSSSVRPGMELKTPLKPSSSSRIGGLSSVLEARKQNQRLRKAGTRRSGNSGRNDTQNGGNIGLSQAYEAQRIRPESLSSRPSLLPNRHTKEYDGSALSFSDLYFDTLT
ncbi:hypothetical protein GYMLUDRAFT_43871 [Collybiopsis luxurians FD-317 M1]|uniref:Uncharacterized protein n=1 Tax=Collybiopsis luxurians FD-317 M1 TaxID=944289 RepID=A0A0D0CN48_9AGAR|nr:hypothetical protein GYMLUDRAFT_43871 [Collybiopsis luxurians FD-317 M1]